MMLWVVSERYKTKCMRFIKRNVTKCCWGCKRKRILIEKRLKRNRSNLMKVTNTIRLVMILIYKNIHPKFWSIWTKFVMKWPRIALKTNGLTLLYFGRTKERKNSLKMLLTTIGWIFHNSENKFKIQMVKANKSNKSRVLIPLDVSF